MPVWSVHAKALKLFVKSSSKTQDSFLFTSSLNRLLSELQTDSLWLVDLPTALGESPRTRFVLEAFAQRRRHRSKTAAHPWLFTFSDTFRATGILAITPGRNHTSVGLCSCRRPFFGGRGYEPASEAGYCSIMAVQRDRTVRRECRKSWEEQLEFR